jgi:hypothetical protein
MLCPVLGSTRRTFSAALCALAVTISASSAHSQANSAKPAGEAETVLGSEEYKALVREGMLKYTRGLWDDARAYFLKAHELAPNARTLRGLALVSYDRHGHNVEAIDYAEQSLAHPVQPLNEKMKAELKQLIQQAETQVVRAEVVTIPADAQLRIDRVPVTRRADGTVWLDPGEHELSVSAPSYVDETRRFQLRDERQLRLEIALQSRTAAAPAHSAAAATLPRAAARSPLPWVVVGVSAGVAAAGGVMLAVDQAGRGDGGASAFTPLGAALLGVGAVGVIVGITWSLAPRADSERAPSARLQLGPSSIQCNGTF